MSAARVLVGWWRSIRAFSAVVLRQLLRDRTALFFIVALPVAIMVIIGSTFGGPQRLDVGIVTGSDIVTGPGIVTGTGSDGEVARRLVAALEARGGVRVHRYDDLEAMRRAIRRFGIAGGVAVPADADATLAGTGTVALTIVVPRTGESAVSVQRVLDGAAATAGVPLGAAAFAVERTGAGLDVARATADALDAAGAGATIEIEERTVGAARRATDSRFSQSALQNLVLFTFITALTSATLLVRARRTGVLRRARATPTGLGTLLIGMAGGWFVLCLLQSVLLVAVGAVGFGVDWGSPVAAALLVVTFDVVGVGAGLLVGAVGRNEDRVGALTPVIGIVAGSLGGCTVPLQFFPDAMRTVSRAVPHGWAVDAWEQLVFDGAGLADIAGELAVLAAFAAAFVAVATLLMRRALQSGS